jgi:hypothetical protein
MDRVGTNGLADRKAFIAHLRHLAESGDGNYERQRRRRNVALDGDAKAAPKRKK